MRAPKQSRRDFLRHATAATAALAIPAAVADGEARAQAPGTGSSAAAGERARKILDGFETIRRDHERHRAALDALIRVGFDLAPELLVPGEAVTLAITARSQSRPGSTLEVIEDCYAASPKRSTVALKWRPDKDAGAYRATWRWRPPKPGSYQVRWKCDVGGDIPEFRRSFAVVDNSWLVVILNSTSHANPRPEPDFHELGLPFSYWAELLLYGGRATAEDFARPSRGARQFGDDPGLMIFMGGDYLPGDQTVFCDEPEDVQRAILECYRRLWPMHGFPKPLSSLYTYGIGNGPAKVARSLGYDLLGALCADQNWGDGPFKINHWGMPARPYFVSREDFRKPGDGGPAAMVGVQQCERQTVECRDYNCVYAFEGGIAYALDQYSGVTRRRVVDDAIIGREAAFLECFAQCAGHGDAPLMVSCGIEFNGVWPDMAAVNRRFLEYAARRGREGKVAYTTATAAAEFLRRRVRRTPESTVYMPDVYAGIVSNGKPPNYPDTMEIENDRLKAIFRRGETLPYAQYDYTRPWSYPDWGNADIPRGKQGYVVPNTDDRFRVTPHIVDTRPFVVSSHVEDDTNATRVKIEVVAPVPQSALALAVWDLPREYSDDRSRFRLTGAQRFVPVRAPFTANLCGILVADVHKGVNRITLAVTTPRREVRTQDLRLGERTMAKVFEFGGSAMAYIFSTGGLPETVEVRPEPGGTARLYAPDSDTPSAIGARAVLSVAAGACWRLSGLTWEQLRRACPSAGLVASQEALRTQE